MQPVGPGQRPPGPGPNPRPAPTLRAHTAQVLFYCLRVSRTSDCPQTQFKVPRTGQKEGPQRRGQAQWLKRTPAPLQQMGRQGDGRGARDRPPTSLRERHTRPGDRDLGHGDKGRMSLKRGRHRQTETQGGRRVTAEGGREELDPWRQGHCAGEKARWRPRGLDALLGGASRARWPRS